MKYNEDMFDISSEFFTKTDKETSSIVNEKTGTLEKELLQILLNKFRSILTMKNQKHSGILKIGLTETADGYDQIKKLIKLGNFDLFASEYCLYLGHKIDKDDLVCTGTIDESYYQLIWDYKTYFETISMHEIENGIVYKKNEETNHSKVLDAILNFKELPLKHQISTLKTFINAVKKQQQLLEKELIEDECKNKGHRYSHWKEINYTKREINPYYGSRDYYVPEEYKYIDVPHTKWERTCLRCGITETVTTEPKSVTRRKNEKAKQEKIKMLEKELEELKRK